MRALVLALGLAFAAAPAWAVTPQPSAGDPRIGEAPYVPDQVVELAGALGYQLSIAFDPAERIENVAIGDALGWQVTPNRRANLLFLKPQGRRKPTNMTVVTNLRRYDFRLAVKTDQKAPQFYSVRFLYPPPAVPIVTEVKAEPAPPPEPRDVNHAYSYEGSSKVLPDRVFDDGHSTYFRFRAEGDLPVVLAMEPSGGEALVNSRVSGGYLVIDAVERGFVLRRGADVTRLFNDGYAEPQPGPLSPKPRPKTSWWRR
jgi:type IV secretion system protein VirB9